MAMAAASVAATGAHGAVAISSGTTKDMVCSAGVCSPTSADAVLNTGDLETLLATGNVEVTTTGSGVQADNILVSKAFHWVNSARLTLQAHRSITIDKRILVEGLAGVVLRTNAGGKGGVLSFGPQGHLALKNLSSSLAINGTAYTLAGSVSTLASDIAANPGGYYALAVSYNASADGTYNEPPVSTSLSGIVEGLGNTISNLTIFTEPGGANTNTGLFADVAFLAAVKDLRLDMLSVERSGGYGIGPVGGLAGTNEGLLSGDETAGVGAAYDCAYCPLGGLVGSNSGTIENSSANVQLKGARFVGGLVASNAGTINLSHATGAVRGQGNGSAGGLVSYNEGLISESYATGFVRDPSGVSLGGLVGEDLAGGVSDSYATGAVEGGKRSVVGGLAGYASRVSITYSYSTGSGVVGEYGEFGGFVGKDHKRARTINAAFTDDCWDTTTSGTDQGTGNDGNVSGITGLTTAQLQSGLPAGFNPSIWAEKSGINGGLPYLIANPPAK